MFPRAFRGIAIIIFLLCVITPTVESSIGGNTSGIGVAGVVPPDLSSEVAITSPITVEFYGNNLNTAFYQNVNLSLFQGAKPIEGDLFYNPDAKQVMFKPKSPLQNNMTYTVQLTFQDGQGGTAEKIWSFRTTAGGFQNNSVPFSNNSNFSTTSAIGSLDNTKNVSAKKLEISKASVAQGVLSVSDPIFVTFSEPLEIASLKDAPVKLFMGKQQVGVDYKLSKDLRTLTIVPRAPLTPGGNYSVAIQPPLAGTAGGKISKNILIPFKVQDSAAYSSFDANVPDHVIEEAPEPVSTVNRSKENAFVQKTGAFYQDTRNFGQSVGPLKVIALTPRNGEVVTNMSQPIVVAFNNEIRQETLNEFTFRVEDEFGPIPGRIKYFPGKKQATLTPLGVLEPSKTYRVILTKGISDVNGQMLQNPINAMFSTNSPSVPSALEMFTSPANKLKRNENLDFSDTFSESQEIESMDDEVSYTFQAKGRNSLTKKKGNNKKAVDKLSAFRISAISPKANSHSVPRNSRIYIKFNEPVDPSTVNNINISIFGNQKRVEGQVIYEPAKLQAVFIPAEKLNAQTEYKVIVSEKIKSAKGEKLVGKYSWAFTTSKDERSPYMPYITGAQTKTSDDFSIPLIDRKNPRKTSAPIKQSPEVSAPPSFSYLPSNHWAFKAIRHITQKGLLPTYPFNHDTKVSRYECAMAVKSALGNLRNMASTQAKPKLRVADLVQLENLVIEFKPELKSLYVDTAWFERFLESQGVKISDIRNGVSNIDRG